jgi:quinol monooxygenase YgiN
MWAQLIKLRVKDGKESEMPALFEQLGSFEQPGSGLIRSLAMQDQKDPTLAYVLVVFESEAHARAREQDPRRAEGMKAVQATMADLFDGPPEFIDMNVLKEVTQ